MARPLCSPSQCDTLKSTKEVQKRDITFQVNDLNQLSYQPT